MSMMQMTVSQLYVTVGCLCVSVSAVVSVRAEQKPEQKHGDSEDRRFNTEVTSAQSVFHSLWVTLADCIIFSKWI